MPRPSTFSIVAHDPAASAWGVAVASKFPAVGAVVPWARAGAGAVATQSEANTAFGPEGLERMSRGESAEPALQALLADDAGRAMRQVGMVDAAGLAATFTGGGCFAWAGGRAGRGYAVQGNLLAGPQVVEQMALAFEQTEGELPARLMTALLAADRAGGDRRGRQSAALLVVKPGGGYGGHNDRWIDYRVDDHPDPVPRLAELLELHALYFGHSPPADQLRLEGATLLALKRMMRKQRTYDGAADDEYDDATQAALRHFIGNENFEERTNLTERTIDRPVFEFLLRRYPLA
jgi:uncharacterized Ntn-hydrolase superfamily protein